MIRENKGLGLSAILAVAVVMTIPSMANASVKKWDLETCAANYDDVWVGEIVSRTEFVPAAQGCDIPCTEIAVKGHSVITGRKGVERIGYPGTDRVHVSIMPAADETRIGDHVLVFVKRNKLTDPRGAMWAPNFTSFLKLQKPRRASDYTVVKKSSTFLNRNQKLSDLEKTIRKTWRAVREKSAKTKGR